MEGVRKTILWMAFVLSILWETAESYSLDHKAELRYDNRTLSRYRRQSQNTSCKGDNSTFQCVTIADCIDAALICDGNRDCPDGSDERESICKNMKCPGYLFRCDYGACISADLRCNGKRDCNDDSDEIDCPVNKTVNTNCRSNQFECSDGQCISLNEKCDGLTDCNDRSDETEELCLNIFCPGYTFKCKYGACVDGDAECDGKKQCLDNSDEDKKTCNSISPGTPCLTPSQPSHGNWIFLNDGRKGAGYLDVNPNTVIQFSCDEGYRLSTTNEYRLTTLCQATGEWTFTVMPVCLKTCLGLYNTNLITLSCKNDGSLIPCDRATDNTVLTYKCAPYYESPAGMLKRSTCYDGSWDYAPTCIPVCGERQDYLISLMPSGYPINRSEYPWVVALYSSNNSDSNFTNICGGSLITPEIVLTAAHCVTKKDTGEAYPVEYFRVGAGKYYNGYRDLRDEYNAQYTEVENIEINREYQGETQNFRGDIALLKLRTGFALSKVVQPVCYHNLPEIQPNAHGVVSGWLTDSGKPSETLQEIDVSYYESGHCSRELNEDFRKYFSSDKICAKTLNNDTGLCLKGSSGDGLVVRNPQYKNRFFIQGILSSGPSYGTNQTTDCDGKITLFTNVSHHTEWIHLTVGKWKPSISTRLTSNKCVTPEHPTNGQWMYTNESSQGAADTQTENTIITFSCAAGYTLSTTYDETFTIRCLSNGKWNTTVMPVCQKLCQTIHSPLYTVSCKNYEGLVVPCDKAVDNTILTYKCATHYEAPPGTSRNSTCFMGSWDRMPNCVPVCGEKRVSVTLFVVNGEEVRRGNYPWVVALYSSRETDPYFTIICGGSLISPHIVLTAAHCVTYKESGKLHSARHLRVGAGKFYNQYDDPRDNETAQYAEVAQIETHEDYKGEIHNFRGDIALLKLKTGFTLSIVIQPVCYSDLSAIQPNAPGLVTGWGYTISSGELSETLRELELPYNKREQCWTEFDEDFAARYFTTDKFCAGYNNRNASVCKGDSGGGLVFRNPNYRKRYFIHGIVSLGPSYMDNQINHCNIRKSALFTKVDTYIGWIQLKVEQWSN